MKFLSLVLLSCFLYGIGLAGNLVTVRQGTIRPDDLTVTTSSLTNEFNHLFGVVTGLVASVVEIPTNFVSQSIESYYPVMYSTDTNSILYNDFFVSKNGDFNSMTNSKGTLEISRLCLTNVYFALTSIETNLIYGIVSSSCLTNTLYVEASSISNNDYYISIRPERNRTVTNVVCVTNDRTFATIVSTNYVETVGYLWYTNVDEFVSFPTNLPASLQSTYVSSHTNYSVSKGWYCTITNDFGGTSFSYIRGQDIELLNATNQIISKVSVGYYTNRTFVPVSSVSMSTNITYELISNPTFPIITIITNDVYDYVSTVSTNSRTWTNVFNGLVIKGIGSTNVLYSEINSRNDFRNQTPRFINRTNNLDRFQILRQYRVISTTNTVENIFDNPSELDDRLNSLTNSFSYSPSLSRRIGDKIVSFLSLVSSFVVPSCLAELGPWVPIPPNVSGFTSLREAVNEKFYPLWSACAGDIAALNSLSAKVDTLNGDWAGALEKIDKAVAEAKESALSSASSAGTASKASIVASANALASAQALSSSKDALLNAQIAASSAKTSAESASSNLQSAQTIKSQIEATAINLKASLAKREITDEVFEAEMAVLETKYDKVNTAINVLENQVAITQERQKSTEGEVATINGRVTNLEQAPPPDVTYPPPDEEIPIPPSSLYVEKKDFEAYKLAMEDRSARNIKEHTEMKNSVSTLDIKVNSNSKTTELEIGTMKNQISSIISAYNKMEADLSGRVTQLWDSFYAHLASHNLINSESTTIIIEQTLQPLYQSYFGSEIGWGEIDAQITSKLATAKLSWFDEIKLWFRNTFGFSIPFTTTPTLPQTRP